jgi:hypothetical protein
MISTKKPSGKAGTGHSKRYKRVAEQNKKERMPTPFESGTVPGTTFITIVATLLVLVGIAFFAAAV